MTKYDKDGTRSNEMHLFTVLYAGRKKSGHKYQHG